MSFHWAYLWVLLIDGPPKIQIDGLGFEWDIEGATTDGGPGSSARSGDGSGLLGPISLPFAEMEMEQTLTGPWAFTSSTDQFHIRNYR